MFYLLIIAVISGVIAGLSAGLLGVGGGVIVVPALDYLLRHIGVSLTFSMHIAIGTSLGAMIITSTVSVMTHHKRHSVLWPVVYRLAPGLLVGAIAAAVIVSELPGKVLHWVFALFLVFSAAQLFLGAINKRQQAEVETASANTAEAMLLKQSMLVMSLIAVAIGFVGSSLGIGGSIITVPYLSFKKTPIRLAIATAAACSLVVAIVGAISYIVFGLSEQNLPIGNLGYINFPLLLVIAIASAGAANLGAKLAYRLNAAILKIVFSCLLLVIAISMLS